MTHRIGIFYRDLLEPGGIPRETELLAKALEGAGASVFLYCYQGKSRRRLPSLEGDAVTVRCFRSLARGRNGFVVPPEFARLLRNNDDGLDVVLLIGAFIVENAAVARILRRGSIPYVFSPGDAFHPALWHGPQGIMKRVYEMFFERDTVDGASAIRLYSLAQAPHLDDRGYSDNGRFFVVKEGIDREDIEQALGNGSTFAGPSLSLTFGFLGRLDIYQKGLDRLLHAWAAHKRRGRPGRLVVAGPGAHGDLSRLRLLAQRLRLPDFELQGPRYGVSRYELLSQFSVLVHPSRHEGIPRVIREALALGCPAVVTPDTNLADVIGDFDAGWVVDGNHASIRDALSRVAAAFPDLEPYRKGALAAADVLDWSRIGETFIDELGRRITLA